MKLKSCNLCSLQFKRNEHLNRHLMIHSGEKKHKCQTCQRTFSRLDALQRHNKLHSNDLNHTKDDKENNMETLVESVFGLMTMKQQAIPIQTLIRKQSIPSYTGRELLSIRNLILAE